MPGPSSSNPQSDYRLQLERRGRLAIITISGSVNMDVSDDLKENLIRVADESNEQLLLDLSELDFICSDGLSGMIAAHLKCQARKVTMKLVSPKPAIRHLLGVTKLGSILPIYDSIDEALADNPS